MMNCFIHLRNNEYVEVKELKEVKNLVKEK